MFMNAIPSQGNADLGAVWVRHQLARIHQKHVQFARHFRVDVAGLLMRATRLAREAGLASAQHAPQSWLTDPETAGDDRGH